MEALPLLVAQNPLPSGVPRPGRDIPLDVDVARVLPRSCHVVDKHPEQVIHVRPKRLFDAQGVDPREAAAYRFREFHGSMAALEVSLQPASLFAPQSRRLAAKRFPAICFPSGFPSCSGVYVFDHLLGFYAEPEVERRYHTLTVDLTPEARKQYPNALIRARQGYYSEPAPVLITKP